MESNHALRVRSPAVYPTASTDNRVRLRGWESNPRGVRLTAGCLTIRRPRINPLPLRCERGSRVFLQTCQGDGSSPRARHTTGFSESRRVPQGARARHGPHRCSTAASPGFEPGPPGSEPGILPLDQLANETSQIAGPGFEPGPPGSKPDILPLDYPAPPRAPLRAVAPRAALHTARAGVWWVQRGSNPHASG